MHINFEKNKPNLTLIHGLFYAHKFDKALPILEALVREYPDFMLYRMKLDECKKKVNGCTAKDVQITEINRQESIGTKSQHNNYHQKKTNVNIEFNIDQYDNSNKKRQLTEHYAKDQNNLTALIELGRIDLIEQNFYDALQKAKLAIEKDKDCRDAYRLAEQSAIELGNFEEANSYFLLQPPVYNPPQPRVRGLNPVLPMQFKLPPIIGAGNDYRHILEQASIFKASKKTYTKTVSIIVPVYNRYKILANTLAALTHQTYPNALIQVIVVDDGSSDEILNIIKKYETKLNLYYARQADDGYRLAAARNIGLRIATGDSLIFMDADILPCPTDVETYMQVLHVSENSVLIGHRRYVDVSNINDDNILKDINVALKLPDINPNNDVADHKNAVGASIDWRFPVYEKTNFLIEDLWPFTKGAGGNIAFSRQLFNRAGFVDEDFQAWGCEDGEHGYRLYNAGAYFIPMMNIVSLHQEPLAENPSPVLNEGESFRALGHKITRQLFMKKCPAPTVRQYLPGLTFDVPKVSIYIPAYNAERYILETIQSCLGQDFGDLEVCICDDGSTDNTLELLERHFSNNPKVRWVSQENSGIGSATNTAVNLCRGMYIAQLDADDCLKPNAVRECVSVLDNKDIDAVYTDCDYIDSQSNYIRDAWCGGEYTREWMATGMIATHFRMFRKRLWSRAGGCNEKIKNAVDLDLWLKFYQKGNVEHIHRVLYSYRWHGENTSIMHRKHQEKNHLKVVSDSLKRMKLDQYWRVQSTQNPLNPREFKIIPIAEPAPVTPQDVFFLIPTCTKYADKMEAVRKTWAAELTGLGFRYLFLMGRPSIKLPEISGDVLYVPCEDNYESLLLKLTLGYQFLYRNIEFSYVYKIDDDCYPNLSKLINDILPQLAGKQYIGGATHPKGSKMNNHWHFGKCSNSKFDKPYKYDVAPMEFAKGGYGYFLRKDVLPILIENIAVFRGELDAGVYSYEDVRIAEILDTQSIYVNKLSHYEVAHEDVDNFSSLTLIYDVKDYNMFIKLKNSLQLVCDI